jgi:hypothetical protein
MKMELQESKRWRARLDSFASGWCTVADTCKHGNELLGFVNWKGDFRTC